MVIVNDFTYIDDIIEGIVRIMQYAPEKKMVMIDCPFLLIKYIISAITLRNLLDLAILQKNLFVQVLTILSNGEAERHDTTEKLLQDATGDVPTSITIRRLTFAFWI